MHWESLPIVMPRHFISESAVHIVSRAVQHTAEDAERAAPQQGLARLLSPWTFYNVEPAADAHVPATAEVSMCNVSSVRRRRIFLPIWALVDE